MRQEDPKKAGHVLFQSVQRACRTCDDILESGPENQQLAQQIWVFASSTFSCCNTFGAPPASLLVVFFMEGSRLQSFLLSIVDHVQATDTLGMFSEVFTLWGCLLLGEPKVVVFLLVSL